MGHNLSLYTFEGTKNPCYVPKDLLIVADEFSNY